jgi:hypothetical protein
MDLFVNFVFLYFLKFHLVLDEGDAKDLDYRWEVAQRLGQGESISVRDVLLEDLPD